MRAAHASSIAVLLFASAGFAQTTTRISVTPGGAQVSGGGNAPTISPDGRYVAFDSWATNILPGDSNGRRDVFLRDRVAGTVEFVSVDNFGVLGDGDSENSALTPDGRFVGFTSYATNLGAPPTFFAEQVYLRDRLNATTERISVSTAGVDGNNNVYGPPVVSDDGRYVCFWSSASNLVPGDTNGTDDVFVRDRLNGTTERVSVSSGGAEANGYSFAPSMTPDGRFVAFSSLASNLVAGDVNGVADVFLRDRQTGTTVLVSADSSGAQFDAGSTDPRLTADGRNVVFRSAATNLAPADANGKIDVFLRHVGLGTTELVSVTPAGVAGNDESEMPSISRDGRYVAFTSWASNLVPGDTNAKGDVFLRDRDLAVTVRVSVSSVGGQGDANSTDPVVSGDGRFVVYPSQATNLVAGDTNGMIDAFLTDRGTGTLAFCAGDGAQTVACPCGNSGAFGHGCASSQVANGALLGAAGATVPDTLTLLATQMLPSVTNIFLQGDASITGANFGDGVRCVAGVLLRLGVKTAAGGAAQFPDVGDPSISARCVALGSPIPAGATRSYQTYYRDPDPTFCPAPQGNTWNVTNGVKVIW